MTKEEFNDFFVGLQAIQKDCFDNNKNVFIVIGATNDDKPIMYYSVRNDHVSIYRSQSSEPFESHSIYRCFALWENFDVHAELDKIKRFIDHKGEWKE